METLRVESIDQILKNRHSEVVMVIRSKDNKYLLIRKNFYPEGIYRLPAGGLENEESAENALKREVAEEFGIEMKIVKDLGVYKIRLVDETEERTFNSYCFLLEPKQELELSKDEEHSEYLWVSLDDLPKYSQKLRDCKEWPYWGKFRALAIDFIYKTMRNKTQTRIRLNQ